MKKNRVEYKLLFAPVLTKEKIKSILAPYGFKDITKADNNIQLIAGNPLQRKIFAIFFIHLLKILSESPDPDMALNNMEKYIKNVSNPVSLFSFFANNLKPLEILILILSHSQFFSDIICINPTYFDWLFESKNIGIAKTSANFIYDLDEMLKSVKNFEKKMNILRIFKRREMLRIGVNDLIDALSQEVVTHQISLLAETLLEAAYQISKEKLQLKYGIPKTHHGEKTDLCIISMGKLGGDELNYSSDIDIIFIYSDEGQTSSVEGKHQNIISNPDFFTKLAEMIIRYISDNTDEGYCFRVDTRLRPDGKSGQLVRSLESMEKYYYSHGETWEQQALIKARVVAGDKQLGKTFLKKIDNFVYRKYLDYQAIQEIKMLKDRIEQEVNKKDLFEREVKLGYGGIRDIEFTVQFLQLLHGGENEILKNTNTLITLKNLFKLNILSGKEFNAMYDGYLSLRKIEHRLQFMNEQQLHLLPVENSEIEKLAKRLGYRDKAIDTKSEIKTPGEEFRKDYQMHTENIRQVFIHLFQGLFQYNREQAEETNLILNPNPDGTLILNILSRYNFYDIKKAYKNLKLLSERDIFTPYTFRTKKYLANILPMLLKGCYSSPCPDQALNNFEYFTAKLGAKTIFYESLKSSPHMISILTNIFGSSMYLSDILIQNPEFLDFIADPNILSNFGENKKRIHKLFKLIYENQTKKSIFSLQKFKILGTILIGINFFMHRNLQRTAKALTQLALFIMENIFDANMENSQLKEKISLCILSLGKLGRKELNFDSDLDIIFCYEIKQSHISSNESMELHFVVCEWIKKFLQDLQKIYKVDLRLRPMGNSGELAIPVSQYLEYFQKQARTWEKIAFLKASFGSGDKKTTEKMITGLRKIIFASLSTEKIVHDIIEMKNLIEKNTKDRFNDFKHGIGGLMEIEFIIDYLLIKNSMGKYFLSKTWTTNSLKILKELKTKKFITSKDFNILKNAYIFLLRIEMTLRLNMTGEKTYILPNDPEWISMITVHMGYNTTEQFISQYKKNSSCVRDIFDKLC